MFERACRGVWPGEGAVRTKTHGWGTCGQRLGTSLQAVQDVDGRDATASERGASPLREVGDGKAAPRSMEMGKRETERGRNVAGARWRGRVDCDGHLPRPYMHGTDTAHTYALPYARRSSRRADHNQRPRLAARTGTCCQCIRWAPRRGTYLLVSTCSVQCTLALEFA